MLNRMHGVFASLQKHDVRYVVIGGTAAILYGVPRATFDVDTLIEASPDNAKRLLDALLDARLGTASLTTPEELLANEITVFDDIVIIDVQTFTPGLLFEDAWEQRETIRTRMTSAACALRSCAERYRREPKAWNEARRKYSLPMTNWLLTSKLRGKNS